MVADIALADGPQKGVGQGVQTGVGVGVADERAVMIDPDPAQPHMIAGPEGVNIVALANAGDARRAGKGFGHGEILRVGELEQSWVAGSGGDPAARALDHLGIVGGILVRRPCIPGSGQGSESEGLRCLGAHQTGPVGGDQRLIVITTLEGVDSWENRDGAVVVRQGL